jgi:ribose 5-phosphate isomerase B
MDLYIGSDHAGVWLKKRIFEHLESNGHNAIDLGVFDEKDKVDYPDVAREVGEKIIENAGARGILVCGTGIGMSIAANKVKGIRAACAHDVTTAKMAALHNNANILTLGERIVGEQVAKDMVDVWMETKFEGGRHENRVNKIMDIEKND